MLKRIEMLLDRETKRDLKYLSVVKKQSVSKLVRNYLSEWLPEKLGNEREMIKGKKS